MREKQEKLAFLFGVDDHWAPLRMFEEVNEGFCFLSLDLCFYMSHIEGIS